MSIQTSTQAKLREVSDIIKTIDLNQLSTEQLESIAKLVYMDKLKKKVDDEITKQGIDYPEYKNQFLAECKAQNTRKVYFKAFEIFEEFLQRHSLQYADCGALEIDRFILSLDLDQKNLSGATKRLWIRAISAFYSKLLRYNFIARNPFIGAKLPKEGRKRKLNIMTEEDYLKILDTLKPRKGRGEYKRSEAIMTKWKTIFTLLRETGLRVGAVKTIKIGENGKLNYYSKGKEGKTIVNPELAKKLKKIDLSKITESSVQKALQHACRRAGVTIMNPHSIRHLFASSFYQQTKDIYSLKKQLNHSSIGITEIYLKSLNAI